MKEQFQELALFPCHIIYLLEEVVAKLLVFLECSPPPFF